MTSFADLVLFNGKPGGTLSVQATVIAGQAVWRVA